MKNANYWWNDEIANLKRAIQKHRRTAQRANKRSNGNEKELTIEYKDKKNELKRMIHKNKNQAWKEFLELVPWGNPIKA